LIASHGSARHLCEVLDALAIQTQSDFDVVVIDNNFLPQVKVMSTVLCSSRLRVIHEPRLGLSIARNVAVAHAEGEIAAFLDDDAVPEPSWLAELLAGLERHGASVAGGSINLGVRGDVPDWMGIEHRRLLAELLYDGQDIPSIGESQYICGGNMAAVTSAFELVGGFSESFGRVGGVLRSSEELEWCRRVQAAGLGVAFVASARVAHIIMPDRLKLSYFLKRSYWQGRSDALLECRHGRPAKFGPRDNRRNLVALISRSKALLCACETRTRVAEWLALVRELGYCMQYTQLHLSRG
jgi:GT2 family glycosyltransferase